MLRRVRAVLLDFGDTLSDQATERRDETGFLEGVDLIAGAKELVERLRERGYALALVADGEVRDARNVLRQHGLDELFDALRQATARAGRGPRRAHRAPARAPDCAGPAGGRRRLNAGNVRARPGVWPAGARGCSPHPGRRSDTSESED